MPSRRSRATISGSTSIRNRPGGHHRRVLGRHGGGGVERAACPRDRDRAGGRLLHAVLLWIRGCGGLCPPVRGAPRHRVRLGDECQRQLEREKEGARSRHRRGGGRGAARGRRGRGGADRAKQRGYGDEFMDMRMSRSTRTGVGRQVMGQSRRRWPRPGRRNVWGSQARQRKETAAEAAGLTTLAGDEFGGGTADANAAGHVGPGRCSRGCRRGARQERRDVRVARSSILGRTPGARAHKPFIDCLSEYRPRRGTLRDRRRHRPQVPMGRPRADILGRWRR